MGAAHAAVTRLVHRAGVKVSAVVLVGLVVAPLATLVVYSIADGYFYPQVLPERVSLRAWRSALDPDAPLWGAMWTSIQVAVLVTVLSLAVGLPAARAMGLLRFRGKRVVEFLLLAPVLVPGIAVALGLQVTFIRYGLADTMPGVVLVHLVPALPYGTLVLSGVFANFDQQIEEQARSLGASAPRTWWHVTLPSIRPGLAVASFFIFIVSWSQYTLTFLVGGGSIVTLPILVFSLATGGDLALASAVSLIFIMPAILLLIGSARSLGAKSSMGGFGSL